jgi:hypothetical protein
MIPFLGLLPEVDTYRVSGHRREIYDNYGKLNLDAKKIKKIDLF